MIFGVAYDWFIRGLVTQASLSQRFPARSNTGHQHPLECPPAMLVQLSPPLLSPPLPRPQLQRTENWQTVEKTVCAVGAVTLGTEQAMGTYAAGRAGTFPPGWWLAGAARGLLGPGTFCFLAWVPVTCNCSIDRIQPAAHVWFVYLSVWDTSKTILGKKQKKGSILLQAEDMAFPRPGPGLACLPTVAIGEPRPGIPGHDWETRRFYGPLGNGPLNSPGLGYSQFITRGLPGSLHSRPHTSDAFLCVLLCSPFIFKQLSCNKIHMPYNSKVFHSTTELCKTSQSVSGHFHHRQKKPLVLSCHLPPSPYTRPGTAPFTWSWCALAVRWRFLVHPSVGQSPGV